jgi:hypothetical protein
MRREQDLAVRIVDVKDEAVADVTARAKAEFEALRESMEDKRASLLASVECKVAKLDAAEAKSRGLEAALMDAQAQLATSAPVVEHPLYGSMLRDFGYKKIYAMPAANLVAKDKVGIYDQQRAFRAERSQVIAAEKAKELVFSLPGVVTLAEGTAPVRGKKAKKSLLFGASKTGAHILDGQHRVGALEILLSQGVIAPTHDVLVEVFEDVDDARAGEIFTEINAAQVSLFCSLTVCPYKY